MILGCGAPEGAQGHNIARNVAVLSKLPIEVGGTEYLEILIHAYAYSRTSIPSEYAGPTKVQARGTLNVIEAVFGGEVEGKMVWAIGANNQTGFRVLEIPDPPRLVIDICTSASG